MQLFAEPNLNLIGNRRIGYIVSGVLLVGTIILLSIGALKMGVDFTGGRLVHVRFHEASVTIGEVRALLGREGFEGIEVQTYGKTNELLIRLPISQAGQEEQAVTVESVFRNHYPDQHEVVRIDDVGPKIGRELQRNAVKAVLWALVLLLIYISWRFELRFAVGAVFALTHDVLLTLGAFMITGREMSLPVVAALLTIVGYSLNDTIVVFDRVREQLRLKRREIFDEVINISLNKSLSRTIITSMTTLVVVLALYLFGGRVINDFAFALLIGVIAGTYSSIFVASPVVVEWQKIRVKRTQGRTAKGRQ